MEVERVVIRQSILVGQVIKNRFPGFQELHLRDCVGKCLKVEEAENMTEPSIFIHVAILISLNVKKCSHRDTSKLRLELYTQEVRTVSFI